MNDACFMNEGFFALLGVVLGGAITWLGDWIRRRGQRRERGEYCALRLVIALDAYVSQTAGTLPPDENERDYGQPESLENPQLIQLSDDVDWSAIDPKLAFRALSIPNRHADAVDTVAYIFEVADFDQARDHRDKLFSKLGLDCADLARDLRDEYGLSSRISWDPNSRWDPVQVLQEISRSSQTRV